MTDELSDYGKLNATREDTASSTTPRALLSSIR